jgi:putative acetyltransferase
VSLPLIFRPFNQTDQPDVRRLVLEGLGDHFPRLDPARNPDLEDIAASYIAQGHAFMVAELAGRLAAAGALIDLGGGLGRLARVSVAGRYRRQGIGRAMVHNLVNLGRKNGYSRLLVETNLDWYAAVALYQRCGFLPYDLDDESIHMHLYLSAS